MEAVELERTAYHESGHTVAAVRLGIPIKRVTIADDQPHLHRARYYAARAANSKRGAFSGPGSEAKFWRYGAVLRR
jgi:hypothetical protein